MSSMHHRDPHGAARHFRRIETDFQLEHVRASLRQRQGVAVRPSVAVSPYGWGTPEFSDALLLSRVSQVTRLFGLPFPPESHESARRSRAARPRARAGVPLLITFFERLGETSDPRTRLRGVSGCAPQAPGATTGALGFAPIIQGEIDASIPFLGFDDTFPRRDGRRASCCGRSRGSCARAPASRLRCTRRQ